ncbi:tetraacyldisaccharide 4'-kinase [Pusillimonas sp. CC-YST705]|uniref:Tetraacyldisaccharide 4'-kinase n=1 Tax=Mesopusillimonas faecipullorum TaxID=2755040 RepID=A0ABS8CA07_9BURK|nr:tetraacyldisaccharide 4'-kinase [Mesopusillimonas faecipullorum]MCB5362879.1 tetraacyldisaccharide 4'-kinase [Mesopusillimonas faecipullorum]
MSKREAAWQHRALAIWQDKGWVSNLLLPLSWLYGAVISLRRRYYSRLLPEPLEKRPPIVVIGNLVVGGTGKTPTVIALAQALTQMGWRPGIVSRGYGVRIGPEPRVGQGQLSAAQFGDEPALIAQATQCPIAVHPQRTLALQALLQAHPQLDVVIADDGLQHLRLPRDLIVIVQDARGVGNGRLLPAGPLREPASRLKEAHTIVTNLTASHSVSAHASPIQTMLPHQTVMRLAPVSLTQLSSGAQLSWAQWTRSHAQGSITALAAIGQPQRFFNMLTQYGLTLSSTRALPDHEALDENSLRRLTADFIVITEKDAIKCPNCRDDRVWSVQVRPEFSNSGWAQEISLSLHRLVGQKPSSGITLKD